MIKNISQFSLQHYELYFSLHNNNIIEIFVLEIKTLCNTFNENKINYKFCYQTNKLLLFDKQKKNMIEYKIKIRRLLETSHIYIIFDIRNKVCNNIHIHRLFDKIFKKAIQNCLSKNFLSKL